MPGAMTVSTETAAYARKPRRTVRASPQRSPSVPETSCSTANGTM
jgi:hypothetical protein